MTIKKLELRNFQVVKDFAADLDGNVYFITGDNELGKSTLLKAIGALLTGERDAVLRNGEEKGFAKMVIGDNGNVYEVKLSFTEANPRGTFTITSKNGLKSNNVSALQELFGYTDFDAVEFSRWSETAEGRRKQIAVVKALLPEDVRKRIDEIDADVAKTKDERKETNAQIKTYETICDNAEKQLENGDEQKYANKVDIADLIKKQTEIAQIKAKANEVRQMLELRTKQLEEIPERIETEHTKYNDAVAQLERADEEAKQRYERAIQDAQNAYNKEKADNQGMREHYAVLHDEHVASIKAEEKDFATRKENAEKWLADYNAKNYESNDISEQIASAEIHNRKHELVKDLRHKKDVLQAFEDAKEKQKKHLQELADEREKKIKQSALPIDGLTFTDDGLELNGVPFIAGKVSDSQIMEVATKLIIASNPKVKVFRIARGESLGEKRLQAIIDIAKRNGFQGFIEEVKRGQERLEVHEYTEIAE